MKRNVLFSPATITSISMVFLVLLTTVIAHAELFSDETLLSDTENLPYYLRDRGEGISTSMFGTYITEGQLFIYPFVEYYYDTNMEYSPDEFGYPLIQDFRGDYRASAHDLRAAHAPVRTASAVPARHARNCPPRAAAHSGGFHLANSRS